MRSGAMRHPVTIETPTRVADQAGGYTETWAAIAGGETFASIEPVSQGVAERVLGAKAATVATHLVRLRYLPAVTTACRVVYGTRTFDVRAVADVRERGAELLLACEERT